MVNIQPTQINHKAGRPRSSKSHQAILEAALALFAQAGLAGMSIEAIAKKASVGKSTIYRRWSSKEDLLKEALTLFRDEQPLPNTGTLRGDLLAIAQQAHDLFQRFPLMATLTAKLIAEIRTTPEFYRAFYEKLVAPRRKQFHALVQRAQSRGEIRPGLDTTFIVSLIFISLVYGNFLNELIDPATGQSYRPDVAVDILLRGIGPHS